MSISIFLMIAALGLVLYVVFRQWRSAAPEPFGMLREMPTSLRDLVPLYSEQTFRCHASGVIARVDRVYALGSGLVPVEFKTRAQHVVYEADVVELSVQALALTGETGTRVLPTAWVCTQSTVDATRRWHPVALLAADEVLDLRSRYQRLKAEGFDAKLLTPLHHPRTARGCATCGHAPRCTARFGAVE